MTDFKVGDRVKCIFKTNRYQWIEIGRIYTVEKIVVFHDEYCFGLKGVNSDYLGVYNINLFVKAYSLKDKLELVKKLIKL
jgi:hypothetical protein